MRPFGSLQRRAIRCNSECQGSLHKLASLDAGACELRIAQLHELPPRFRPALHSLSLGGRWAAAAPRARPLNLVRKPEVLSRSSRRGKELSCWEREPGSDDELGLEASVAAPGQDSASISGPIHTSGMTACPHPLRPAHHRRCEGDGQVIDRGTAKRPCRQIKPALPARC